jgi:hypothetical protein
MNGDHEHEEGPPDTRPYFCIPYWSTPLTTGGLWDTGQQRPLPGSVLSYACESIRASAYVPGEELRVSVAVRNSGGGNSASIATVVVYWADLTVGFAGLNFFGATTVAVKPDRVTPASATTPTMTARIPPDAPPHICLLAIVSHPQDPAGNAYDPVGDRHWAQRNLTAVPAAPGEPLLMPFRLGNPFPEERELLLEIAPADERRAAAVAATFELEATHVRPRLLLLDEAGNQIGEGGETVTAIFGLRGREEIGLQVLVEMSEEIPRGTVGTIEALAFDDREERRVVGGVGIALLPRD